MNKWSEIFAGLVLLIGAILIAWFSSMYDWALFGKSFDFLNAAWIVLKGSIFWMVFFVGLFLIVLGINDLRD